MGSFFSRIFKSSLISSICLVILGGLLFFQSEATIISISYVIGGILIAIGVLTIMKYINNYKKDIRNEMDIIYGTVTVILGIIVIGNPKGIASIIPFVIGILIILSSATKLQYSLDLKKNENDLWVSTMVLSLITMLVGILLIFNPFQGAEFITKIVGILISIYAILDIISTITIKRTVKKIHNAIEETITEAEVIEEKNVKKRKVKKENDK